MKHVEYVIPGSLLACIGFCVLFYLLASRNALAKSAQLQAIGSMASGEGGPKQRRLLLISVALMVVGTCGAFAGVGVNDSKRRKACTATCVERGYQSGTIRGSTELDTNSKKHKKHAFVACACENGPTKEPLELRAEDLDY